jgi:hypothetical protein
MFRRLIAISLLLASTSATFAQELDPDIDTENIDTNPVLLLSCGTGEDARQGQLKMVADQYEDGSMTNLQFHEAHFGIEAAIWPGYGEVPEPAWRFSNSDGPDGYFWDYTAQVRGDVWHLFYVSVAATEADEVDSSVAGLAVVDATGKLIRHVQCGETPIAYFFDLEPLTGCDETNPFGAAACSLDGQPRRETSLLETYPWLETLMPADWQFRT